MQLPISFTKYSNNLNTSDRKYYFATSFDFYPLNSVVNPTLEISAGKENLGVVTADSEAFKFNVLNSIADSEFLFQQMLYMEYFNFSKDNRKETYWGLSLDLFYYLPFNFSAALNIGYSFDNEITSPVNISNVRKNTYRLGLEAYF